MRMSLKSVFEALIALLFSVACLQAGSTPTNRTAVTAVDDAHRALWNRFIDGNNVILDFVGSIPTPQECELGKPNAMGWNSPIENGPMFTGLYLPAACERAKRSGKQEDREEARKLAHGLLRCAAVSDVPGMIVRGFASDGMSHYPIGSDDQTHPWFHGLYHFWRSDIPSDTEKREIVRAVKEVADALEQVSWECPCDGSFKGQFRGGFKKYASDFRGVTRFLSILRMVYEMTGELAWLERYQAALSEKPWKRDKSRADVCSGGYEADLVKNKWDRAWAPHWTWIYVGAVAALRHLAEVESDAAIREKYRQGLASCVSTGLLDLISYSQFDNDDDKLFGSSNWRAVYTNWFPQKDSADATRLSKMVDKQARGERGEYEFRYACSPLAAAAIVALSGDAANRPVVEAVIRHYNYEKLNISRFFFAECAFYALPEK